MRDEERVGRITAEQELRRIQQLSINESGLKVKPIGIVETCYRERNGTPRQGCLVPSGRGVLRLGRELNPVAMTDGLAQFSHVWLVVRRLV